MGSHTAVQSIPSEIIWNILESGLLDHHDIFALCFIRIFHTVAIKLLYQSFPRYGNLHTFLAKILRNPQLAAQVRSVDLPSSSNGPSGDAFLFCDSVTRLQCPISVELHWKKLLRAGDHSALATLLLAHLPGIRRLSIDVPWETVYSVVGLPRYLAARIQLARSADPSAIHHDWFPNSLRWRETFSQLQEVAIEGISCPINSIAAILGIPSIQKLRLGGMVDDDSHVKLSPKCSNVQHLTINSVAASFQCVAEILLACKNLRHFFYHSPLDERISRNLTALFRILSYFGGSLEEMQIRDLPSLYIGGAPRSLVEFTALRDLACDASVLTHPSRISTLSALLPTGIRKIQIYDIYADFWQQFGSSQAVHEDLTQRLPEGTLLFAHLEEVKLVKGSAHRKHGVLRSENLVENGVKFCLEQFVHSDV